MDPRRNPELAQVLQALNNASRPARQTFPGFQLFEPESGATALVKPKAESSRPLQQPLAVPRAVDPKSRSTTPSADSSRITTWQAAQKFVIDNIYSNEKTKTKIKQLIANQHQQERKWWDERQALIAKHRGRAAKGKQADALLAKMGGIAPPVKAESLAEEKAELMECDKKIYSAMTKLMAETDRELRALGVPFYAIRHELVIMEDGEQQNGGGQKLDRGELRELQKRVLQLLEELVSD